MAEKTPPLARTTSSAPSSSTAGHEKRRRCRNWESHEVLLLVRAKKMECEHLEESGKKYESSAEKWGKIVECLQYHGITDRDAEVCRSKWDNLLTDYKNIKDYQSEKSCQNTSYQSLKREEKKLHKLPASFDPGILALLDSFQGKRLSHNFPYMLDSSRPKASDAAVPKLHCVFPQKLTAIRNPRQADTAVMRTTESAFPRPVTPSSLGSESQYDNVVSTDGLEMHPIRQLHRDGEEELQRDREEGFGGKKRKTEASSSQLLSDSVKEMQVSYVNTLLSMEEKKDDRQNKVLELERERINIEREDRKELIAVLGALSEAFDKIANSMTS